MPKELGETIVVRILSVCHHPITICFLVHHFFISFLFFRPCFLHFSDKNFHRILIFSQLLFNQFSPFSPAVESNHRSCTRNGLCYLSGMSYFRFEFFLSSWMDIILVSLFCFCSFSFLFARGHMFIFYRLVAGCEVAPCRKLLESPFSLPRTPKNARSRALACARTLLNSIVPRISGAVSNLQRVATRTATIRNLS